MVLYLIAQVDIFSLTTSSVGKSLGNPRLFLSNLSSTIIVFVSGNISVIVDLNGAKIPVGIPLNLSSAVVSTTSVSIILNATFLL